MDDPVMVDAVVVELMIVEEPVIPRIFASITVGLNEA